MKKLLAAAVAALTLAGAAFAQKTFVLDMAESSNGTKISIVKNEYGTNYQSSTATQAEFGKQLKGGFPAVGDIVQVNYKFTSDVDLDMVKFGLIDTSPAANYWTAIDAGETWPQIEGIVKGKVYQGVLEFKVDTAPKAKITVVACYDDQKIAANLTFQKTGVVTTKVAQAKRSPKTFKVDLGKYAALITFSGNYPWVNGVQDRSTLLGYRSEICINDAFGGDLPIVGDTVIINYKGVSNYDINNIKVLLYEHAECVGWWAPLCPEEQQFQDFANGIKAGTPFKSSVKFTVTQAPQEDVSLCFDYTTDDCNGSSMLKVSK